MSAHRQRAVVLLSGGMDSCVCAALAARDYDAAALHISYGQRTEGREQRSFHAICDRLGFTNRLIVRNPVFAAIGGSALTDPNIAVPVAPPDSPESIRTATARRSQSPMFRSAMRTF